MSPPLSLMLALAFSLLNFCLLSATDPDTCSNSFVVTQPDTTVCETFAQLQVTALEKRVAELEGQLDQALGRKNPLEDHDPHRNGPTSRGLTPNPSFRCQCGNITSFSFVYKDCQDIAKVARGSSGLYDITPITSTGQIISTTGMSQKYWAVSTSDPVTVYCDVEDGHSWTLLMRRSKMDVNFTRTWDDYKHGFGNMTNDGDFWLGLQTMHLLTTHPFTNYTLWVKIVDKNQTPYIFPYNNFKVLDEESGYRLNLGKFFGKAPNLEYFKHSHGQKFIARSHMYRRLSGESCAWSSSSVGGGGWWFGPYQSRYETKTCGYTNLNAARPFWEGFETSEIQSVEMRMRPGV